MNNFGIYFLDISKCIVAKKKRKDFKIMLYRQYSISRIIFHVQYHV